MVKVATAQPRSRGFELYIRSGPWLGQEAELRVNYISCENLFHNRAKINTFKLKQEHELKKKDTQEIYSDCDRSAHDAITKGI